jgi:hypothetical protein
MDASANYESWLKEAQERMESWEEGGESYNEAGKGKRFNPWSTIHIDTNGLIIAVVFAYRVVVSALFIVVPRSVLTENPGEGPTRTEKRRK